MSCTKKERINDIVLHGSILMRSSLKDRMLSQKLGLTNWDDGITSSSLKCVVDCLRGILDRRELIKP